MTMHDMLRLNLLEEICSAGRRACLPESICQILEWSCQYPRSKTAHRLLRHVSRIVNHLPMMPSTPGVSAPDAYKCTIDHAIDVLVYDLYYDAYSDVDAADRVAIMALLV